MNRKTFFSMVRSGPFPGRLTADQVTGMDDLLNEWEKSGSSDPRHLAYVFATNFHETGTRMQPVREHFKKSDAAARKSVQRMYARKSSSWYSNPAGPWGKVYYGRGDVQLTWYDNYVLMGEILGIPLAENPDLALNSKISKRILIEGMLKGASGRGDFTNACLEDYFNDVVDDPEGARRVVNGTDKAQLIASYYREFLEAVEAALEQVEEPDSEAVHPIDKPAKAPRLSDETSWGAVLTALGGVMSSATALYEKLPGPWALAGLAAVAIGVLIFAHGRRGIVRKTGE